MHGAIAEVPKPAAFKLLWWGTSDHDYCWWTGSFQVSFSLDSLGQTRLLVQAKSENWVWLEDRRQKNLDLNINLKGKLQVGHSGPWAAGDQVSWQALSLLGSVWQGLAEDGEWVLALLLKRWQEQSKNEASWYMFDLLHVAVGSHCGCWDKLLTALQ